MSPLRPIRSRPHAAAAHAPDAVASTIRAGVVQVGRDQQARSFSAVDAGEQEGGSAFENRKWSALQKVRKAHVDRVFAAADGEDQAGVGVKLDAEARRTAITAEARENALEKRGASGDR